MTDEKRKALEAEALKYELEELHWRNKAKDASGKSSLADQEPIYLETAESFRKKAKNCRDEAGGKTTS